MKLPLMKQIFRHPVIPDDPYRAYPMVGVKVYQGKKQFGEVWKLKPDASEDEFLNVEAHCVTSCNLWAQGLPAWGPS